MKLLRGNNSRPIVLKHVVECCYVGILNGREQGLDDQ